jgi:hypothetical protein
LLNRLAHVIATCKVFADVGFTHSSSPLSPSDISSTRRHGDTNCGFLRMNCDRKKGPTGRTSTCVLDFCRLTYIHIPYSLQMHNTTDNRDAYAFRHTIHRRSISFLCLLINFTACLQNNLFARQIWMSIVVVVVEGKLP